MTEKIDLTRGGTHCSKCGGEKDAEGWCPNYCMDEGGNEVRVGPAVDVGGFDFSDLSEKHLDEALVAALGESLQEEEE